ncbi:DUF3383 domain-containing protein [Paraburkholderia sp. BR10923]|uniref:DUF3383 domain-containing protein n=1 Tax=Paraburkholderia sp. BR10923 TaxID=3236992 RepID=UPI0034CF1FF0
MATTLPLSRVVNVQLNLTPIASALRNFGMLALFSPEVAPFNDAGSQWLAMSTLEAVSQAWGLTSETYAAATKFFAQSPRPRQLIVARWDADENTIPATAAAVFGRPVTQPISTFSAISDGSFSIPISGVMTDYSGIDLSQATTFAGVAQAVDTVITPDGLTCIWDNVGTRFIIQSRVTGAGVQLGFVTGSGSGYLGAIMGLDNVSPTYLVPGTNQVTQPAQTLAEAMQSLSEVMSNWYAGVAVRSPLDDATITAAADYIMGADRKVFGVTAMSAANLSQATTNIFRQLYDRQAYRVVAQYDHDDRYAIISFLARALSVNFQANNTTITMKFKQQPLVTPEPLTETQASQAEALGINYYAYFDDVAMVAQGTVIGGRYWDEVHILDWFCDEAQRNVFNVLYLSPTKVPLTDPGTHRLVNAIEKACRDGVRNGAFAPGVWTGDEFGELASGDYLDTGWYIWADSVDNLSDTDRDQRRAPPIQVALKLAGAIHTADVIVNFVR